MKIQLISDLHIEHAYDNPDALMFTAADVNINADVVVLAGDIDNSVENTASYIKSLAIAHPSKHFVAVPGNHEFNSSIVFYKIANLSALQPIFPDNMHFDSMFVFEHNNVRFLCTTLWPFIPNSKRQPIDSILSTMFADGKMNPFTSEQCNQLHHNQLNWLVRQLNIPYSGKTVVVTHFAPTVSSIAAQYIGDIFSHYFYTNLEDLIEEYQPMIWLHGHTHNYVEYNIGNTLVASNPLGYQTEQKFRYNVFDYLFDV